MANEMRRSLPIRAAGRLTGIDCSPAYTRQPEGKGVTGREMRMCKVQLLTSNPN